MKKTENFSVGYARLDGKCLNRNEVCNYRWRARSSARLERQKSFLVEAHNLLVGSSSLPGPIKDPLKCINLVVSFY